MKKQNEEIRISDLLHVIFKRRKMILIFTIVGLIMGMLLSAVSYLRGEMSKQYAITSSFAVTSITQDGLFTTKTNNPNSNDIYLAENMVDSVIYVMRSDRVLNAAIEKLNLLGVTDRGISDNLSMRQYNETQIVEMTLYWRSAEEGVQILRAINSVAPDILIDTLKIGSVSVVNEPRSRYIIGGSMNVTLWGILAVVGAMLGAFFSVVELFIRPTLINLKDIENLFSLNLIGAIPQCKSYFKDKHTLPDESERPEASLIGDHYLASAHILRHTLGEKPHQCLYITSAGADEGKTTVAANLAFQLSELGHKVLLVDLDVHNPCLARHFTCEVDYTNSINAIYRGDTNVDSAIIKLTNHLDLLPSILEQTLIPIDDVMLSLLRSLKKQYDCVLIDTPSVGYSAELMSLKQVAQGVLLVIQHDTYPIDEIRETIVRLEKSGIKIIGCIVNNVYRLGKKPIDRSHAVNTYAPRRQTDHIADTHQESDTNDEASEQPDEAMEISSGSTLENEMFDTKGSGEPAEEEQSDFEHQEKTTSDTADEEDNDESKYSWSAGSAPQPLSHHEVIEELPPTNDVVFRILSGERNE